MKVRELIVELSKCDPETFVQLSVKGNKGFLNGVHGIFWDGLGSKADDFFIIFLGANFHKWIDNSGAPKERINEVLWILYKLQIELFKQIGKDPYETAKSKTTAKKALNAFGLWVYENRRLFEAGDWQLEYIKCPDCTEYKKDPEYAGYSNGCPACEKRMLATKE